MVKALWRLASLVRVIHGNTRTSASVHEVTVWVWAPWSVRRRRWSRASSPPLPSSAAAGTPHPAVPSLYLTSLGGRDGRWVMEFLKMVEGGKEIK